MHTVPDVYADRHKRMKVQLTPKLEAFVDSLVLDALTVKDAALLHGIRVKRANWLLTVPAVVKAYRQRMQVLRDSAAARGIHVAISIMESGIADGATAATKRVALDAWKAIEGQQGSGGGTSVNVTVNNQVAGYVVDLSEGGEAIGNRMTNAAKPLIEHAPVGHSDE